MVDKWTQILFILFQVWSVTFVSRWIQEGWRSCIIVWVSKGWSLQLMRTKLSLIHREGWFVNTHLLLFFQNHPFHNCFWRLKICPTLHWGSQKKYKQQWLFIEHISQHWITSKRCPRNTSFRSCVHMYI